MIRIANFAVVLLVALAAGTTGFSGETKKNPAYTDPANAGPDFAFQGEYAGTITTDSGDLKYGAQVIALGEGKFRGVGYPGGLPGDGWDQSKEKVSTDGELKDGAVLFNAPDGTHVATLRDGQITVKDGEKTIATLKKVERKSPTLGAKPPAGAVVLFDGSSTDNLNNGRVTEDKLLIEGAISKQKFGSSTSHLEFLLPFQPLDRGQGRANSGYYVQGRYEIQILDSFGLEGLDNECGGLYHLAKPKVNMCYPPLAWQTYDVDFTAAEYQDGKKVKNARLTVRHNGVVIQDNLEIPDASPGPILKETDSPGPIYLQNHGNPVRFRNIWVVEKK